MKIFRKSIMMMIIILIIISYVSALQLSAETGCEIGSSSTQIIYGATKEDYADQHIALNPKEGTISNSYSGSGSLPGASISKTDSKGNYVYVYRSVSGSPATTKWTYDWRTYVPYSSTAGYGVGAELWLSASRAYSIYGEGYSSNKEGDRADAYMSVGSSNPYLDTYLSGYYVNPTAFTNEARVYQKAGYASSTGPITIYGYANNAESDYSKTKISVTKGTIYEPTTNVYSGKTSTWTYPTAKYVYSPSGTGSLYAYAYNKQGDSSYFGTNVYKGIINYPNFYAWSGTKFAETYGKMSNAYGSTAEINSQAFSKILGYQEHWYYSNGWKRSKTAVSRAEGDFAAKKTSNAQFGSVSVTTRATNGNSDRNQNDITIQTSGFGSNTALILDPRRWEFVNDVGGSEIRDSVMTSLKNKGYAVTYYSDSAVSKNKVKQMDEYKVSTIHSHSSPTLMYLSKSTDGTNWDNMQASELKSGYTNNNGMALVIGCNSFTNTGTNTWADATSKANVRGGTTSEWGITYGRSFINKYYAAMGAGYTASSANNYAGSTRLKLIGNTAFKL